MLLSKKAILSEEMNGHSKTEMEQQMDAILDQLDLIHLKLKANVDSEVWMQFQTQTNTLKQMEMEFNKLKQLLS